MATKKTPAKKTTREAETPAMSAEEKKALKKAVNDAAWLSKEEKKMYVDGLDKGYAMNTPTIAKYKIDAYDGASPIPVNSDTAFYDSATGIFTAFEPGEPGLYEVLDCIAHASENGHLNSRTWVKDIFKTEAAYEWFLDELTGYDQCYRINDRWWAGLARLAEHEQSEEGFVHTEDMADELRKHARETNQRF